MSRSERPWARHYQDEWHRKAGDPRLPYWLRIAALAYGSHGYNGHATFKRSEIALVLATVDQETGEVEPYRRVGRAIEDAIAYGWLDAGSFWGCLVVPAHAIKKGTHGRKSDCPVHLRRSRRQTPNCSLTEQFGVRSSPPDEQFEPRSAHSLSSSQRAPLSLVSPTSTPTNRDLTDPDERTA